MSVRVIEHPTASRSDPQITDSDVANARRLAERHGQDLRFTPERGWFVWDGRRWAIDDKSVQVQARAKETALSIFDEVRNAADRDAAYRHAKRAHPNPESRRASRNSTPMAGCLM
jgi:hypothetical protein